MVHTGMVRIGMAHTGVVDAGTVYTGSGCTGSARTETGTGTAGVERAHAGMAGTLRAGTACWEVCHGAPCRVVCIFPDQGSDADYLVHQLEQDRVLSKVAHAEAGMRAVVSMDRWVYLAWFSGLCSVADEGGAP